MRSRRTRNSSTIAATESCGPVSASTPAHWVAALVQLTLLTISRLKGVTSFSGTMA